MTAESNLSPRRPIKCRYKYLTSMQFNKDNTCMWIYYLFYENCFLWMDGQVKCRHIAWSFLRVHMGRGRQETTFSCSKHVYVCGEGGGGVVLTNFSIYNIILSSPQSTGQLLQNSFFMCKFNCDICQLWEKGGSRF